MLVLNTGQVPWDIGRQLETVYGQFIKLIQASLGENIEIFRLEDNRRRSQAAQYQSKSIVELLLIFSPRKNEIDIKERISEDFVRLDAMEASSNEMFIDQFIIALKLLTNLDKAFSRLDPVGQANSDGKRIRYGKDIFGSFPAMAGFCSAVSVFVFDEPGFTIPWGEVRQRMKEVEVAIEKITVKMAVFQEPKQLEEFLQLQLLEEKLSQRSGQVGRFEREFYRRAFTTLIRNAERIDDLTPCWMAH
jgi:hypothetical protein